MKTVSEGGGERPAGIPEIPGIPPVDGMEAQGSASQGSARDRRAPRLHRVLHQLAHLHTSCAAAVKRGRMALSQFSQATEGRGRRGEG